MSCVLRYELVDDDLERRAALRAEHLALAHAAAQRGELRLGGALADPVDCALLVFCGEAAAEAFARADPYVREGLVRSWGVRRWTVVIGADLPDDQKL